MRPRAQPYVLRREANRTYLHFLWIVSHRKALIERKLAKQRAGRPLGNLRHHPQSELSDAELRRRLAWVAQLARSLRRPWSDAAPPAPAAAPTSTDALAPSPRRGWRSRVRSTCRHVPAGAALIDHASSQPSLILDLVGRSGR